MPFLELGALIAILKSLGLPALIGKLSVAWKGLSVCANAGYLQHLAYTSFQMIQSGGAIYAVSTVINMLIILGTFAAGSTAAVLATEALELFANGKFEKGMKKAAKATLEAKAAHTGIKLID